MCLCEEERQIRKITLVQAKPGQGRFYTLEVSEGVTESIQFSLQSSSWTNISPEQRKTQGRRLGTNFLKFP